MLLLVSGATATLRRFPDSPYLGTLVVPAGCHRLEPVSAARRPWAADNAAFTGFYPVAFCRMLGKIAGRPGCRFVACPDAVGDARATLRLFATWAPVLHALGLPVALVAQDGMEALPVPWDDIAALFVGGSTAWKLGPGAAALVREAKRRGKWVHFGRCNTKGRFRHAYQLGCDSVDGSGFSRWPDQRVPMALDWLGALHGDAAPGGARDPTVRAFFRGGLGAGVFGEPGWTVERVGAGARGFVVRARFSAEPPACPHCGRRPPEQARLFRHGSKVSEWIDAPRHGRPVRVIATRPRFRCAGCGRTFAPDPPGVQPGTRLTRAALAAAREALRGSPPDVVAARLGVHPRTLRRALR